jgi:acyl-CoA thioesterase
MILTPLSDLLARRITQAHEVQFDVPEDWLQGRTSFGGLVSAYAVQAMRDVAAAGWPPEVTLRALQTNFIAPVEAGPLAVRVGVLREGRSVRQVQAKVWQRDELCALMVGVFGSDRTSRLAPILPSRPPAAKPVDAIPHAPFAAGRRPTFTVHLDMRWADGAPPFSGQPATQASIHLRLLDDDAKDLPSELMSVLMADAFPTPVLAQFDQPTPASSVSWALELRPLSSQEAMDGWWRADSDAIAMGGGYVNQQARLWSPGGALAALAYQVVTIYG